MKLAAMLLGLLLVGACGGGQGSKVTPSPLPEKEAKSFVTAPIDPEHEARAAYSNPGGMWMPAQMLLPGHAAAFTKLGV